MLGNDVCYAKFYYLVEKIVMLELTQILLNL